MNRTARGALIGGAVGALVAVAQTVRAEDDPPQVVAVQALKGGAQGALVGSLVGWVLDRTAASKTSGVAAYAEVAKDAWSGAVETAEHAYEVTRPRLEQAYEVTRPKVEYAYEVTRPKVEYAYEVALPVVEQAAEVALELAEAARRRAS